MFEIKIIKPEIVASWMRNYTEMSDTQTHYWAKTGAIKVGRHFRYVSKTKKCKTCNTIISRQVKKLDWK